VHSSRELRSASFAITVDGDPAAVADVLPGFRDSDRLGIVVRRPCGVVGASALLLAVVTAFYDVQRGRGEDFFIYPDYFVFHVGRKLGSHNRLDIWPPHKEVVVADEPEEVLRAINDRGITRLVVEDGVPYRPARWHLWRDPRVFVPHATIQNWVEAGGKKGAGTHGPRLP